VSTLDPSKPVFICVMGKKGYGKSRYARWVFDGFPGDKLVIDTTGDVAPAESWRTEYEVPDRWPMDLERKPITLRYVPDPTKPSYQDDIDRMIGVAYEYGKRSGRRIMVWIEEVHEVAASNRTRPHMRRVLRQGRHAHMFLLTTDIRPITVDPLVIAQADVVVCFRIPGPADRKVIADNMGWELKEPIDELDGLTVDEIWSKLEKFHYTRYEAEEDELVLFEPLPIGAHVPHAERLDEAV